MSWRCARSAECDVNSSARARLHVGRPPTVGKTTCASCAHQCEANQSGFLGASSSLMSSTKEQRKKYVAGLSTYEQVSYIVTSTGVSACIVDDRQPSVTHRR